MARDIRMTQNQNSTLKQQASNISTVKNLATKMWKIRTPYDPSGTTRSRTRPPWIQALRHHKEGKMMTDKAF